MFATSTFFDRRSLLRRPKPMAKDSGEVDTVSTVSPRLLAWEMFATSTLLLLFSLPHNYQRHYFSSFTAQPIRACWKVAQIRRQLILDHDIECRIGADILTKITIQHTRATIQPIDSLKFVGNVRLPLNCESNHYHHCWLAMGQHLKPNFYGQLEVMLISNCGP